MGKRCKQGGLGSVTLVGSRLKKGFVDPYWARAYECGRRCSLGFFESAHEAHAALAKRNAERAADPVAFTLHEINGDEASDPYLEACDHRSGRLVQSPERALWAAIMLQAIQDVRSDSPSLRGDATKWIMADSIVTGRVDFPSACSVLGLDVAAAREQVFIQKTGTYVRMGFLRL